MGLTGWVNNSADGVHIEVSGLAKQLDEFVHELFNNPPPLSVISNVTISEVPYTPYKEFKIIASDIHQTKKVGITPDYAICEQCEQELKDPENRRYRYPFITCTQCGPRYSIIKHIPYDREHTSMDAFSMCPTCSKEYENIDDRRYYSQTNSCSTCGVTMSLYTNQGPYVLSEDGILKAVHEFLNKGEIVAVKGIGGFLLLCDATNPLTVSNLRKRKYRPSKPFALLYPSEEVLEGDVNWSSKEREAYCSVVAPVVLMHHKLKPASGLVVDQVAPGLDRIGVMRPYAPLLALIAQDFNKPLIATSGNISQSPIIFENRQAINELLDIADAVLVHNRDIVVAEDDSVVMFTSEVGRKIILRRSRGLAPNYFGSKKLRANALAMGASMKSTFAIQAGTSTYISQYLGDQQSYEVQENYKSTLEHLLKATFAQPDAVIADLHPQYFSSQVGAKYADKWQKPFHQVQHHEAHFAAVLAENNLLDLQESVLGVIWDGTGYGHDHQIWGSEFFLYKDHRFNRVAHLNYYPHLLGDKMSREPRLSALSMLRNSNYLPEMKTHFNNKEWLYYNKLIADIPTLHTCSMGRLFDAVACVLELADKVSYEGEAALYLEQLARKCQKSGVVLTKGYSSPQHILEQVIRQIKRGVTKAEVAKNFHRQLVYWVETEAQKLGVKKIAFSGGVFQNSLLVDMLVRQLGSNFELYFHQDLSPNDENISYGQLVHYIIHNKPGKFQEQQTSTGAIKILT